MRTPTVKKVARFLGVSPREIYRALRPFNYERELRRLRKPLDFKLLSLVIPHGASRDFLNRFEKAWDTCVEDVLKEVLSETLLSKQSTPHPLLSETRPKNTKLHHRIVMLCEEIGVGEFREESTEVIIDRIKQASTITDFSNLFANHARHFRQKDVNRWFQEARRMLKDAHRREEVIHLWKHLPPHYRRLREDVINRALRISNKSRPPRKRKHKNETTPF